LKLDKTARGPLNTKDIPEVVMPLSIRDEETTQLVTGLARRRGMTKRQAIKAATLP
jgi:hypothetical protein